MHMLYLLRCTKNALKRYLFRDIASLMLLWLLLRLCVRLSLLSVSPLIQLLLSHKNQRIQRYCNISINKLPEASGRHLSSLAPTLKNLLPLPLAPRRAAIRHYLEDGETTWGEFLLSPMHLALDGAAISRQCLIAIIQWRCFSFLCWLDGCYSTGAMHPRLQYVFLKPCGSRLTNDRCNGEHVGYIDCRIHRWCRSRDFNLEEREVTQCPCVCTGVSENGWRSLRRRRLQCKWRSSTFQSNDGGWDSILPTLFCQIESCYPAAGSSVEKFHL